MLQDFVCMDLKQSPRSAKEKVGWVKSDEGWIKVNTDGAFDAKTGNGGSSMILRGHGGDVIAVEAKWYSLLPDALTSEALAARDGLLLAVAHGCSRVILETDCSELVNPITSQTGARSPISGLWHEIRELSRVFLNFQCVFVSREAN
ncbi:hypothetical protein HU200_050181 [Digitaria exilis]|uniref:RNase H type-1 domain-containing protein n=1 Tax=Digitaria exilis TaxID=1010633 RepID=A0A835B2Z5_9POAL|nr:hypothetical protein HU200_050181 [Digitaria exilis]